jgi:type I restriction enzyme S subunit
MGKVWEIVKLGKLVDYKSSFISIDDTCNYNLCRVQTKVQGVVLRGTKVGSEIKTKKQQLCKSGDLIFAEMDARFGGYGIVPAELNNSIVSSHYFLFIINEKLINKCFLEYCLKQSSFQNQIEAKGSTNYAGIRPQQVLSYEIPLPPLSEQQRIVAKIESIQNRIEQIQKLRAEQEREIESIRYSIMTNLENTIKKEKIRVVCNLQKGSFPIMKTEAGKYPFVVTGEEFKTANAFDFDCEATCVPMISSTGHGNAAMHRVHYAKGKFALSNLLCAIIPQDDKKVNAKFLYELFMAKKDEYFVPLMSGTSNVSLNIDKLGSVAIPLPLIEKQNRIVTFLEKVNQIRQAYKVQEAELSELLPSLLNKAFKGELVREEKATTITTARSYELETQYFPKRKALGAYIINQSLNDDKFGDTKFEKLMHLAEYWAIKRNFNQQYHKQTAGPYDNHFTFEFYNQVQKAKWFVFQKSKNEQTKIIAGINRSKSQNYYDYFSEDEFAKVNTLIDYFNKCDYKEPEIVSTIYAVWNNRIIRQQKISDKLLIQDFYDWDEHKKVYPQDKVQRGLDWMREKGIVPDGWGEVIERVGKKKKKKRNNNT